MAPQHHLVRPRLLIVRWAALEVECRVPGMRRRRDDQCRLSWLINYFKDLEESVMPAHAENVGTAVRWVYAVTEAAVPTSAAACPLGIP